MTDDDETPEAQALRVEGIAHTFISLRQRAFAQVFLGTGVDGMEVLGDLAEFCRAHNSTFHENPALAARLDGRREVWLRIQQHLRLTDQQLWDLYRAPKLKG